MRNLLTIAILLISFISFGQNKQSRIEVGQKAPMFKAIDQNGKSVVSRKILKQEQLILVFYRGQWCPYCNRHLAELQENVAKFKKAGARLIAISPENLASIEKTVDKTNAEYSILYDADYKIMKEYGVNFSLPKNVVTRYKEYGIDLTAPDGEKDGTLPVPATYVIGKDGIVKYVHYDPDYKNRSSSEEILKHL